MAFSTISFPMLGFLLFLFVLSGFSEVLISESLPYDKLERGSIVRSRDTANKGINESPLGYKKDPVIKHASYFLAQTDWFGQYVGINYHFSPPFTCSISMKYWTVSNIEQDSQSQLNKKGNELYYQGNYIEALSYFLKSAQAGDGYGQYSLGYMYLKGQGTDVDYSEAYHWLEKSGVQNISASMYWLGRLCQQGWGTQKNDMQAFYWFKKGAELGEVDCMKSTAIFYHGDNNYREAFDWFLKCAEAGDKSCAEFVGLMYYAGEGVWPSKSKGKAWLKKAGYTMCLSCWGKGREECWRCHGNGYNNEYMCKPCGGGGYQNCTSCDGLGVKGYN